MPTDIFKITDTYGLLYVVERITPEASYLVDTFFNKKMPVSYTKWVSTEFRESGRVLAPFVSRLGRGVNVNRGSSKIYNYSPPTMGPRRVIGLGDIELRQFGETPVFSRVKPDERAARMQADDLTELLRTITNRKNLMAAEILQTGKVTIHGYADDMQTVETDTIEFAWNGLANVKTDWDNPAATIYDDIRAASERIQEDAGIIPTLMICGKNVEKYLLNNTELYKWLSIDNRDNLNMMSFTPRYTSPQARDIGKINSLNLEIKSYLETYTDDITGEVKPFIDPDTVIIGIPGQGKQLFGAVTFMNPAGQWETIAAENVPVYVADYAAQQSSLTIYSRCLLVPATFADWITLKVKQ